MWMHSTCRLMGRAQKKIAFWKQSLIRCTFLKPVVSSLFACDLQSAHTGPDVLPLVQPQSDVSFLDSTIKLSRIKKSKENQTICVESPALFVLQPHFQKIRTSAFCFYLHFAVFNNQSYWQRMWIALINYLQCDGLVQKRGSCNSCSC